MFAINCVLCASGVPYKGEGYLFLASLPYNKSDHIECVRKNLYENNRVQQGFFFIFTQN